MQNPKIVGARAWADGVRNTNRLVPPPNILFSLKTHQRASSNLEFPTVVPPPNLNNTHNF